MSTRAVVFLLLAGSCQRSASTPPNAPPPISVPNAAPAPGPAPGQGCQDIAINGSCTFSSLAPYGADAFQLTYLDATGRGLRIGTIRAAPGDRAALERFYREHSPAHCEGQVITAPCPPTERITLGVPPPPVGRFEPAP
jgi:hypothetical protein